MIAVPISGDRLKNARVEVSTLSDDALAYLLGVALVSLNDHVDDGKVPETKAKLLYITECLQGPSEKTPSHISEEARRAALALLKTFLDHLPNREQPKWAQ